MKNILKRGNYYESSVAKFVLGKKNIFADIVQIPSVKL